MSKWILLQIVISAPKTTNKDVSNREWDIYEEF